MANATKAICHNEVSFLQIEDAVSAHARLRHSNGMLALGYRFTNRARLAGNPTVSISRAAGVVPKVVVASQRSACLSLSFKKCHIAEKAFPS